MANLLRGAMNLLGGTDLSMAPEQGRLVGKSIEIDKKRFAVKSQIAQGGFATVYTCQEAASGAWFALKSQLANDAAAVKLIQAEMNLLRDCSHPHILRYCCSVMGKSGNSDAKELLMITELCSGGSVIDLLTAGSPLTLAQVANITHGASAAIAYLHARSVPVTHRDMKVENLLFSSRGFVKLCDFGSATTEEYFPADDWNAARRTLLEEDFQRATTPMYRAPEILDTYLGYPVTRLQDVWALGCVLFYLCHRTHPFEDSAKLRIIYAKYAIPEDDQRYTAFRPLIECTLRPDPRERPSAAELQQRLEVLAVALDVRVDTAVPGIDTTSLTGGEPVGDVDRDSSSSSRRQAPPEGGRGGAAAGAGERRERQERQQEEAPPATTTPATVGGGGQTSTTLSQLRGQGLSMFRNLKERSAAVIQTVQSTYGSRGPEIVWLTSRIVLAPQLEGIPEPLAAQAEDSLRRSLADLHRPFKMINLATRRLRCEYPEAVADVAFPADTTGGQSAPMDALLGVAHAAGIYLRSAPPDAFVVLIGSEVHSSLAALALLVYHRVLPKPWCAIELLQERRKVEQPLLLPPSSHRLLDALYQSVQPHFITTISGTRLQLESLVVEHLPAFNNNRSGCRPLLMVYVGGTALWSPQSYETLRAYEGTSERARVQFGLKKTLVAGDVCVVIYHARMSSLSQRMHQIPMISFGLHTALLDPAASSLELRKGDLDYAPAEEAYVPEDIRVTLHYSQTSSAIGRPQQPPGAQRTFYDYPGEIVAPRHVVASAQELDEMQQRFTSGGAARKKQQLPVPASSFFDSDATTPSSSSQPQPPVPSAPPAAAAAAAQPTAGFFDSLAWDAAPATAAAAAAPPPPPPHRGASISAAVAAAAPKPHPAPLGDRFQSMMLDAKKETPILGGSTSPANRSMTDVLAAAAVEEQQQQLVLGEECEYEEEEEVDLLGIGSGASSRSTRPAPAASTVNHNNLLFDAFDSTPSHPNAYSTPQTLDDLFGGPPLASSSSSSLNNPQQQQAQQRGGDLDDLLGLGSGSGGGGSTTSGSAARANNGAADLMFGDLLGGGSGSSMHRNASAPSFAAAPPKKAAGSATFDPFADFLAATPAPTPAANASSANSTRSNTPAMQQPMRPNYSRSAFDTLNAAGSNPTGMPAKPKTSANAFDDLLQSQGFASSGGPGGGGNRTMGDMRRAEDIRDLTPEQIKIRDWTAGKERNIRALLASLSEVLWADDPRWDQPNMASLLTPNEVKKYFRKAAIVVHPDKQTGKPHAELSKAIMIELNDAWNAFEEAGSPSLT